MQVTVVMHGSSSSGAALRKSDVDLVISGVPNLPPPDRSNGNGYIPFTRERVSTFLDALHQCEFPFCVLMMDNVWPLSMAQWSTALPFLGLFYLINTHKTWCKAAHQCELPLLVLVMDHVWLLSTDEWSTADLVVMLNGYQLHRTV